MQRTLIVNANIVNEGMTTQGDVFIKNGRIEQVGADLSSLEADEVVDADGAFLIPGVIDDQVHFREPGLTHKADLYTESRAAVAGGVTSFMEMPNTIPNTLTQELLQQKYDRAAQVAAANYSFFMGASNDNLEEVLKTDPKTVCGVKIFMGSSTGNMLVDDEQTLENLFSNVPMLIATHCEDEASVRRNEEIYRERYGENVPFTAHPLIRSEEACYLSSSRAVAMAKKHNTRLHILHISTAKETHLFDNSLPLEQKRITSEACVHHLWFTDADYEKKGSLIKWNPAVKTAEDRAGIWEAVLDDRIDVIATDHAPHTIEEKSNKYFKAPSGGPLIQHSLVAMVECHLQGKLRMEQLVQKMTHNPAIMFKIKERGFIREGYHADLVLVDTNKPWEVTKNNVIAKCGWSPFEGQTFRSSVTHTWINGQLAYKNGEVIEHSASQRLEFER